MIIETYKIDNATVNIHDDYIKSEEESIEILNRVSDIILRAVNASKNKGNQTH